MTTCCTGRSLLCITGTVGGVGTRYQYLGHVIPYRYRLNRGFSNVIPTIPTIPRYFEISIPAVPARSSISQTHTVPTIPSTPTIPRYFEISIPTVPAQSGIFKTHTD
ncbi:unnamed protein product, partial [Sphacelaria rigidula]